MTGKDCKSDSKPNVVTGEVALIVTPEMREKIERKRLTRQKTRLLGEDLPTAERAEIDLGDIDT